MKQILLFFAAALFCYASPAQTIDWARGIGGTGSDVAGDVATDASGNVYTTGYFSDTVDFDPGPGTFTMASAGGYDIFVLKLDASGNFAWAKRFGRQLHDFGIGIATDAAGNVFVCGEYRDTVDFDPGPLTYTMAASNVNADAFVMKLDASGNFMWSAETGAQDNDQVYAIAIDASGNVNMTGSFVLTADFDPGPGTYTINSASRDIFVWKLSNTGSFIWAKAMGGYSSDWGLGIAVDAAGNVYTSGNFRGVADFDPGPGSYTIAAGSGFGNGYISKLDASGNFVWAIAYVSNNSSGYSGTFGLTIMPNGDLLAAGDFRGVTDFDPGAGVNNVNSLNRDGFVTRINPATGSSIWINFITGPADQSAWDVRADAAGNVFVAGYYVGLSDFDPAPGIPNIPGFGNEDVYLCNFDGMGNFLSVFTGGGSGPDFGISLDINTTGEVHMVGWHSATAAFGPGVSFLSAGNSDATVLKFRNCASLVGTQPVSTGLLMPGSSAQFAIVSPGPNFQWQENDGTGFVNLSNSAQYSGVTTATLTVSNVAYQQNNYLYRCLVASSSCSLSSAIGTLSVAGGTGLDEHALSGGISISPNPASGLVYLAAPLPLAERAYILCDQTGRLVMSGKLSAAPAAIDVSGLPGGLYFIQLENAPQPPLKLIKQ